MGTGHSHYRPHSRGRAECRSRPHTTIGAFQDRLTQGRWIREMYCVLYLFCVQRNGLSENLPLVFCISWSLFANVSAHRSIKGIESNKDIEFSFDNHGGA